MMKNKLLLLLVMSYSYYSISRMWDRRVQKIKEMDQKIIHLK